jgi:hypothetical protein
MGYRADILSEPATGSWIVSVRVNLNRAESNELFLSGDTMLSWPVDGLALDSMDGAMPERSSMFVSEVAARPSGLRLRYREKAQAEYTVALLRMQFSQIGIGEGV